MPKTAAEKAAEKATTGADVPDVIKRAPQTPSAIQASAFEKMLIAESINFIRDHAVEVKTFSEATVRAILMEQIDERMNVLPELPENASMGMIAEYEALLTARTRALQLVAKAFKEDAKLAAKLRGDAYNFAGKIAGSAAIAVGGIIIRSALGL